ncbi:5'-3' exoribonuclease 3-like isoform X3 [Gastrolobium bilobum]|uniref:5'-3' exoribonuclease 3-like isoform X3 n=1 Tax=Gastrolobium bilobum TaxID=150636 RepID=UPI002AB1699A|nr:5'-3' exoribonuclease 3-like isoform X3 [Gastrolobium bilobum]
MGVPSFYRWLIEKYPRAVENVDIAISNPDFVGFDNLYLDMNGIIHPCFHPEDLNSSQPTTFEDVFRNIFDYIDRLVSIVRPRKLLYLAIDGVAPRAKMNQQRTRRFRTAKDNDIREAEEERLRKHYEMEGKQVLPKQESEVSDSNIITPGTEFMHKLSEALKSYISLRITCDSLWRDIMVILSDANVPGEGEHKIISYIRKQRSFPEYDPNTSHCLYGLDADLIMLGMATHEPYFSILREDVLNQEQKPQIAAKPFQFLHIWLLREYLEIDMKIEDPPKNFNIDFERIIDDFIFMCFFAGNDFLPHMPSLDIHERAIDLLITVYKKQFPKLGGYLVDISRVGEKKAAFVKLSRVEKFILMVGTYEEKIFKKRSEIRERKLRRLLRNYEDAKQEEQNSVCYSDLDNQSSSDSALLIKKAMNSEKSPGFLVTNVPVASAEILRNTKELKEELNKCIRDKCDLFKSGDFQSDKIKLGTPGYKERYYKEKFSVEGPTNLECKRKEIVQKYTEGLLWVLQYYFSGVASWTWFYPYHYGPFASDIKGMGQVRLNFEKGVPFLPFDQLLSVLPPRSAHALPNAYAQLMLDDHSRILDFYPLDFEVDKEGKRFSWQGICKLPWIDERRLLAETRELKKELSENEATRNSIKVDSLFVRSTSKLAVKISSLSLQPNPSFKLDTSISDGIGGTISLCHEYVEEPCSGMDIHDNIQEDRVLCVHYELPVHSNRIPGLLSGLNLPTKTIFEDDIMETELWHEVQNQSHFDRMRIHDKWRNANSDSRTSKFPSNETIQHTRSFSSNVSPEVLHKGVGVGWSSGRGKPSNDFNMKRIDTMENEKISSLSPFHKQPMDAGSYNVNAMRDTRSQNFMDNFRQLRISESNHMSRPNGRSQFQSYNNGSYHQGSQSETMPFGRGRGRLQQGSNNVNSWRTVSTNNSLRPQWSGAQVKDQNRC